MTLDGVKRFPWIFRERDGWEGSLFHAWFFGIYHEPWPLVVSCINSLWMKWLHVRCASKVLNKLIQYLVLCFPSCKKSYELQEWYRRNKDSDPDMLSQFWNCTRTLLKNKVYKNEKSCRTFKEYLIISLKKGLYSKNMLGTVASRLIEKLKNM